MPPVLTVAVVNYETPELTANCVRSVLAAPPAEPFETLVVDNGSSQATRDALRALDDARTIETGVNGGFAVAVNRCVAEADSASDVVVVLNSDTQVEPGALDALAHTARGERVGLAAPLLLDRDGSVQCSAFTRFPTLWTLWGTLCLPFAALWQRVLPAERAAALTVAEHEAGARPQHVTGAAMAFHRDAWDAIGPFDERYFLYYEETEWQQRLRAAGWEVELTSQARVKHLHRGGEAAVVVPPLTYLDSTRIYYRARGRSDLTIRATVLSALLLTYLSLLLLRPFARWLPERRELVEVSLQRARHAISHVVHGHTVPRPG